MRGRILTSLILFTTGLLSAQGLTGTLTTTEGDLGKPVRVIAKHGSLIIADSTFLLGGTYTVAWSPVGVDKFDYQVPQPKLLGLANSITSDGYVSLILDGKNTDVDYRVFDMRGRNITGSDHYPVGTYFLQAFNNNSILGTERFVNYSGQLNVDFREPSKQFLGRIAREGADSLLVFYEGEDMQVERFAQEVNVPESGSIDFPVELIRTLRTPHVEINNVPDNPTIDTAYLINLLASREVDPIPWTLFLET